MAAGNFGSPMQLLILLAIVLLIFGGKRLRNLGGDLGGAIKGFKNSMATAESDNENTKENIDANGNESKLGKSQLSSPVLLEGKAEFKNTEKVNS